MIAFGNHHLLSRKYLLWRNLDSEVTTGNHDPITGSKDLIKVINTLIALNLQTDIQTDRDRQTERQTDRQGERQADRQTDRERDRQTRRETGGQTDKYERGECHTRVKRSTSSLPPYVTPSTLRHTFHPTSPLPSYITPSILRHPFHPTSPLPFYITPSILRQPHSSYIQLTHPQMHT